MTKYFCLGIVLQFTIYMKSNIANDMTYHFANMAFDMVDDMSSYFADLTFDMANKFYANITL